MYKTIVFASMGHLNVDIYLQVDKIPDPDSRESARQAYVSVGGAAVNYAITIAKLGAKALLFASCGQDVLAEYALDYLVKCGVDVRYVRKVSGTTGIVVCLVDSRGVKYMIAHEGANRLFSPPDPEVLEREHVEHVHVVFSEAEHVEKCLEVLSSCARHVTVSLGMRTQIARRGLEYFRRLVQRCVKFVFMNYPELVELTGEKDLEKGLSKLLDAVGCDCEIVVTLGERGSVILADGVRIEVPTIPVKAVDTTGAGDVYAGVYTLLRKLQVDPETAGCVASFFSAVKCTLPGASSIPSPEYVANYLRTQGFIEAYAVFSKVLNECLNISV